MPNTTDFELAFLEDLREILIVTLRIHGVVAANTITVDDAAMAFYNCLHRSVEPRPRHVHRAPELRVGGLAASHAAVIDGIEAASLKGGDLRPFLSTRTTRIMATDGLLNDWGLLHFHLGSVTPGNDGFVTRSGPLLFVLVRPDDLYMVAVLPHHEWTNDALIETVHANWPEVLAPFRANAQERVLSEKHRRAIRRKGGNMLTKMRDGTLYFPPGGGQVCSGTMMQVRIDADCLLDHVRGIARWCCDNEGKIRRAFAQKGVDILEPVQLGLVRLEHEFGLIEATTGTLVRIHWDDDDELGLRLPPHEQIAVAAYLRWCGRGRGHGSDVEDWFAAKKALGCLT